MQAQCRKGVHGQGLWDLMFCIAVISPLFGALADGKTRAGLPGLLIGGLIGFVVAVASAWGLYSLANFTARQSFVRMFLFGYMWSLGATFISCRIVGFLVG